MIYLVIIIINSFCYVFSIAYNLVLCRLHLPRCWDPIQICSRWWLLLLILSCRRHCLCRYTLGWSRLIYVLILICDAVIQRVPLASHIVPFSQGYLVTGEVTFIVVADGSIRESLVYQLRHQEFYVAL